MLGFQSFEELATRNLNNIGFEPSYQRQQFVDLMEKNGEIKDSKPFGFVRTIKNFSLKKR